MGISIQSRERVRIHKPTENTTDYVGALVPETLLNAVEDPGADTNLFKLASQA